MIAPGVMIDLLNPKLTVFFFAFLPYGVFAVTFVALSARLAVESC